MRLLVFANRGLPRCIPVISCNGIAVVMMPVAVVVMVMPVMVVMPVAMTVPVMAVQDRVARRLDRRRDAGAPPRTRCVARQDRGNCSGAQHDHDSGSVIATHRCDLPTFLFTTVRHTTPKTCQRTSIRIHRGLDLGFDPLHGPGANSQPASDFANCRRRRYLRE